MPASAPRLGNGDDPSAVVDALREHGAVLIDQLIDDDTVSAVNREVDDAVSAAQPGSKTVNDAI